MGLFRDHPDFRRLWTAFTISELGSQVSMLAIPLIAVISMRASTFQAAALVAAGNAAFLLVGLPAGAWVDRIGRRPVMVTADVIRAVLIGSVPVAYAGGWLTIEWLAAVALGTGLAGVFFDLADLSLLPAIIGGDGLVAANARLETSRSVAYAVGPGLSGGLINLVGGPLAMLADALSFLWSAGWVSRISMAPPEPVPSEPVPSEPVPSEPAPLPRTHLRHQIGAGFRIMWANPILRANALYNTAVVLFWSLARGIETVFLVRVVHLHAGSIGLVFTISSVGAVAGGYAATRLSARLGTVRAMLIAAVLSNLPVLLIPLTGPGWRLGFFVAGVGVSSCFVVAFNVVSVSYRQGAVPVAVLGRTTASMRFLSWGSLPVGSLLGGWIAIEVGIRTTLWISALGGLLGVLWLLGLPRRSEAAGPAGVPLKV